MTTPSYRHWLPCPPRCRPVSRDRGRDLVHDDRCCRDRRQIRDVRWLAGRSRNGDGHPGPGAGAGTGARYQGRPHRGRQTTRSGRNPSPRRTLASHRERRKAWTGRRTADRRLPHADRIRGHPDDARDPCRCPGAARRPDRPHPDQWWTDGRRPQRPDTRHHPDGRHVGPDGGRLRNSTGHHSGTHCPTAAYHRLATMARTARSALVGRQRFGNQPASMQIGRRVHRGHPGGRGSRSDPARRVRPGHPGGRGSRSDPGRHVAGPIDRPRRRGMRWTDDLPSLLSIGRASCSCVDRPPSRSGLDHSARTCRPGTACHRDHPTRRTMNSADHGHPRVGRHRARDRRNSLSADLWNREPAAFPRHSDGDQRPGAHRWSAGCLPGTADAWCRRLPETHPRGSADAQCRRLPEAHPRHAQRDRRSGRGRDHHGWPGRRGRPDCRGLGRHGRPGRRGRPDCPGLGRHGRPHDLRDNPNRCAEAGLRRLGSSGRLRICQNRRSRNPRGGYQARRDETRWGRVGRPTRIAAFRGPFRSQRPLQFRP